LFIGNNYFPHNFVQIVGEMFKVVFLKEMIVFVERNDYLCREWPCWARANALKYSTKWFCCFEESLSQR
jgi:hypothetical protein